MLVSLEIQKFLLFYRNFSQILDRNWVCRRQDGHRTAFFFFFFPSEDKMKIHEGRRNNLQTYKQNKQNNKTSLYPLCPYLELNEWYHTGEGVLRSLMNCLSHQAGLAELRKPSYQGFHHGCFAITIRARCFLFWE